MTTIYNWEITQLECHPEMDGKSNVVFRVGWARSATNGEISVCNGGSTQIPVEITSGFTEFDHLRPEQIVGWVVGVLGEEGILKIDELLDAQIDSRINPPVVSLPLPWA